MVDIAHVTTMVIKAVAEWAGAPASAITREQRLVEDLNFDSLDTVEVVMEIEDTLDIDLPDDRFDRVKTVGELIDLTVEIASAT